MDCDARGCRSAPARALPKSCCAKDIDELPDGTALVVGSGEDAIWYKPTWFSESADFVQVRHTGARLSLCPMQHLIASPGCRSGSTRATHP
jgi:hypothetical protein